LVFKRIQETTADIFKINKIGIRVCVIFSSKVGVKTSHCVYNLRRIVLFPRRRVMSEFNFYDDWLVYFYFLRAHDTPHLHRVRLILFNLRVLSLLSLLLLYCCVLKVLCKLKSSRPHYMHLFIWFQAEKTSAGNEKDALLLSKKSTAQNLIFT